MSVAEGIRRRPNRVTRWSAWACVTILAPIFITFSRSVVSNQCSISLGSANVSYRSTNTHPPHQTRLNRGLRSREAPPGERCGRPAHLAIVFGRPVRIDSCSGPVLAPGSGPSAVKVVSWVLEWACAWVAFRSSQSERSCRAGAGLRAGFAALRPPSRRRIAGRENRENNRG